MIRSKFARKLGFPVLKGSNDAIEGQERSPNKEILNYVDSLLSDARKEIDRADAKASILLASSGVAAGALLGGLVAGSWTPLKLTAAIQWAWWFGIAESAFGILCLALAVYPRERNSNSGNLWAVGYYRDVLAYSTTADLVVALNRSVETNIELKAEQLRQVSWIVDHKYRLIRWGMQGLLLAAVTIVAAIIINLLL